MGDRGHPCYFCTVQNWVYSAFLSLLGCQRWADEPETRQQTPPLGVLPCNMPGQQEEAVSSSQLQVLGLTRQPHSSPFPSQILVSRKPRDAAVWWGNPAQPPRRVWDPHSPLKHYKQNSPSAPGLGCPLRHCHPTPAWLSRVLLLPSPAHKRLHRRPGPKEVISCSRCICKVWVF